MSTRTKRPSDSFVFLQEYKADIKSGKYVIGEWMKRNIAYVEHVLDTGECVYDHKKAASKIRFIEEQLRFTEGRSGPFKLEVWQKYIVACVFGLVDADGYRHFTEFVLIVGRKQGKSALAGALEATCAFTQRELGMQLYNLAPKLQQANIIYNQFGLLVESNPNLRRKAKRRRTDTYIKERNATVAPLAFNSKKSDGFNPYFACFDEFAAWEGARGMDMYNVMLSAQGARHDPINIACSTANFVDAGLYDELFARSTAVLNGTSEEKALLPFLYMIDDPEKWDNIHELKKSLPNLGVSFYEKNLRAEINKAHASPNYKGEFITKYCNLKQNTSIAWLKEEWIKGSQCEPLDPTDFYGMACVGGVDLSQTTDLTAAVVVISFDGKDYILCHFWMPTERVAELSDRDNIDYMSMVSNGHLSLSGGKYVDYHDVTNWFLELRNKWKINVLVIGYDRYSAQYFVDEMRSYGYLMDDVLQGTNLTPMIYEFEGLIADGKIKTGTNGLLHLHMRSSALQRPAADKRVRLVKTNQRKHIDGMAATIDALTVRNKYANKYSWLLNANRRREVGE